MKTVLLTLLCLAAFVLPASAKPHSKSATYETAVQASVARATASYPDYGEEGTRLHQAIQDEVHRQRKLNPGYFKNTDWPERIARDCAAVLGIEPARPMQASK